MITAVRANSRALSSSAVRMDGCRPSLLLAIVWLVYGEFDDLFDEQFV